MRKRDENDPHSAYEVGMPRMVHLDLFLIVDFARKVLAGAATITFDRGGEETTLDTRDLNIVCLKVGDGPDIPFEASAPHRVRGTAIRFVVPVGRKMTVTYETSPKASGLQWLEPELTLGKSHPMLFTQGQALNAPSYVPCQNTPSVRFTFDATIEVPKELRALMGGEHVLRENRYDSITVEQWRMPQPIPAYLIAFAVGEFHYCDLSLRCRVYAEPGIVFAARDEFADVDAMIQAVEANFGEYVWGRFDFLVLPPSFPYGGMENPRLTFLSPTVIAGDKSLVNVLAHELGHSWAGNLIGNAGWMDFWLNEGWTTYLEWRIIEILFGTERMYLEIHVAMAGLRASMASLADRGMPQYTALSEVVPADLDPDDLVTLVPYVKGALFLLLMERTVGRERFDQFIRRYISTFAFQAITTERFLAFVESELPSLLGHIDSDAWVFGQGLPANAPVIVSALADQVEVLVTAKVPAPAETNLVAIFVRMTKEWNEAQWHLYLQNIVGRVTAEQVAWLDQTFQLSSRRNAEVCFAFLTLAIRAGYEPRQIKAKIRLLTQKVGRLKFLRPIYTALAATPAGYKRARRLYRKARPGYHPVTASQISKLLKRLQPAV